MHITCLCGVHLSHAWCIYTCGSCLRFHHRRYCQVLSRALNDIYSYSYRQEQEHLYPEPDEEYMEEEAVDAFYADRFCDVCDCEVSICPCIKCYDSNASFQSRIPVHKTQLTRMGGMDGTSAQRRPPSPSKDLLVGIYSRLIFFVLQGGG